MLSPNFIEQMRAVLGAEVADFEAALQEPAAVSLRLNPAKMPTEPLFAGMSPVPWTQYGHYLAERPFFTADPRLHAGVYYVQEPSSMFLEVAMRQVVAMDRPLLAADLCAAPGGKSTHLSSLLPAGSWLVANEPVANRNAILTENLQKWGLGNALVTQNQPEEIAKVFAGRFDLVLVDAPCSGEGLFRKMPDFAQEWSMRQVEGCALRQRPILEAAWELLGEGGVLLYSTCTFNRQENEENVLWLMREKGAECRRLEVPADWGVTEREEEGAFVYRFFPHRSRGEGFSLAVLIKNQSESAFTTKRQNKKAQELAKGWTVQTSAKLLSKDWGWLSDRIPQLYQAPDQQLYAFPEQWLPIIAMAQQQLRLRYAGLRCGEWMKKELKPAPEMAFWANLYQQNDLPVWDLDLETAQHFLRLDSLTPPSGSDGWYLVRYAGAGLGWAKKIGNRVNNYYPKEWKIVAGMDRLAESP